MDAKKIEQREWRDSELVRTDGLVVLPDYPNKTETIAYRVKLRDWPSTSDFPDTKPIPTHYTASGASVLESFAEENERVPSI